MKNGDTRRAEEPNWGDGGDLDPRGVSDIRSPDSGLTSKSEALVLRRGSSALHAISPSSQSLAPWRSSWTDCKLSRHLSPTRGL